MSNEEAKQLEGELQSANKTQSLSPMALLLNQLRITVDKQLPKMDFLFQLFGKPCFPRRELVAVTGKAKSGKGLDLWIVNNGKSRKALKKLL